MPIYPPGRSDQIDSDGEAIHQGALFPAESSTMSTTGQYLSGMYVAYEAISCVSY
jgi:hypothetical protein